MGDHVLFFYGTLMAPQILHRVIHGSPTPEAWQKALLTFKPAVLHGYRRHRVRGADYPGIARVSTSSDTINGSSSPSPSTTRGEGLDKTASVFGTVVSGLTQGDLHRLDIYEGAEYAKERVSVRILQESLPESEDRISSSNGTGIGIDNGSSSSRTAAGMKTATDPDPETDRHLRDVLEAAGAEIADEGEEVEADTYVWSADAGMLEEAEWDFEAFKRDKMAWWVNASEDEW
ncbi:putative disease resistance protein Aig2 [Aspergillus taichungensis]|uniref:Putative gamma-glutamylcyclotransferase n=1 Tax=Aspergillus taichungensis TaxID=482145 RepID=A0A2J5HKR4_9EURO|nr:putative disease resistance protein Aig2 [Aspergillus taichungensis]